MSEPKVPEDAAREQRDAFCEDVDAKQARKERAQAEKFRTAWFGLGTFGLVGWSVAIPAVIGVFLGLWLDRAVPGRASWTITLLVAGLLLGGWNAWMWMEKESRRGR